MGDTPGPGDSLRPFDASLAESGLFPLTAKSVSVLQVNMGKLCNLSCRHCHVEAGPGRIEAMSEETVNSCIKAVTDWSIPTVDITGGAPEMNPNYRGLVKGASKAGARVITRTNLTVIFKEGYKDLPQFFSQNGIEVVASLPYYLKETVDKQRGEGIFDSSIEALKSLNAAGYGVDGKLALNLVYNPCGAYLPPAQKAVEADFRRELKKRYGISFTSLFTITNMPVGRFLKFLRDSGNLKRYMERLHASYNPSAAANVMCRETVSVGWDGSLYDCDFNQTLGLKCGFGSPEHIRDFDGEGLGKRRIVTEYHCYGCTAGAGSSCTGAVV